MKLIVPVATGTRRMISHRSLAEEKEETSVIVPINPAQGIHAQSLPSSAPLLL